MLPYLPGSPGLTVMHRHAHHLEAHVSADHLLSAGSRPQGLCVKGAAAGLQTTQAGEQQQRLWGWERRGRPGDAGEALNLSRCPHVWTSHSHPSSSKTGHATRDPQTSPSSPRYDPWQALGHRTPAPPLSPHTADSGKAREQGATSSSLGEPARIQRISRSGGSEPAPGMRHCQHPGLPRDP